MPDRESGQSDRACLEEAKALTGDAAKSGGFLVKGFSECRWFRIRVALFMAMNRERELLESTEPPSAPETVAMVAPAIPSPSVRAAGKHDQTQKRLSCEI